jgi:hypothetical protein
VSWDQADHHEEAKGPMLQRKTHPRLLTQNSSRMLYWVP